MPRAFYIFGLILIALLVGAASYDILQRESDLTLEYFTLLVCVPATLFLVYRLSRRAKTK